MIRFRVKSREDDEALLAIIKEALKSTLKAFVEDIKKRQRKGKDRTRLQERVKAFVKELQRQDFLNILLRDHELRNLMLQLEVLTA